MLKNYNILVTGGAGFIGSHICEELLNRGVNKLRILDNLSSGKKKNISHLLKIYNNVEFMWGDIKNLEICKKACKDVNIICHQAALVSVINSMNEPLEYHEINVNGFMNILIAAKENNIKRIIYASSSSVYGDDDSNIKKENKIGNQLSPYATSKYINEIHAKMFTKLYNMECIGLRYFNVFGPRQNINTKYSAVIPTFINKLLNNTQPIIYGDGNNTRDFTYVKNIVEANIKAITTSNDECYGEIFNVGSNNSISINYLFNKLNKIIGKLIQPNYQEERKGDIKHSNASIEKINKLLGYNVLFSFEEGLNNTYMYYLNNKN